MYNGDQDHRSWTAGSLTFIGFSIGGDRSFITGAWVREYVVPGPHNKLGTLEHCWPKC